MTRMVSLDYLRVFACFGVVSLHFGSGMSCAAMAVPIFMALSIFLGGALFEDGDVNALRKRIVRLYKPFLFWGLVYFAAYSIVDRELNIRIWGLQMLLGAPACPALYFIFLLAICTVLLFLFYRSRWKVPMGIALVLSCFALQYSGWNYAIFKNCPFDVRMVLGRFVELLPSALAGMFLYELRGNRGVLSWLSVGGLSLYPLNYLVGCHGFGYQGVGLFSGTVGVVSLALLFPNVCFGRKIVEWLSSLAAGIYYVHLLVGKTLELVIGRQRGWMECFSVFLISVVVVATMKRVNVMRVFVK